MTQQCSRLVQLILFLPWNILPSTSLMCDPLDYVSRSGGCFTSSESSTTLLNLATSNPSNSPWRSLFRRLRRHPPMHSIKLSPRTSLHKRSFGTVGELFQLHTDQETSGKRRDHPFAFSCWLVHLGLVCCIGFVLLYSLCIVTVSKFFGPEFGPQPILSRHHYNRDPGKAASPAGSSSS